ncbi:MAG: glyoxalase/bleomycin resistance/dioxygenase family protein [Betaproteobacteria bacterium]|nr:MAG: glyoxalase/bleomycin resistance/dioxygenase family protein [Betaproteobacteria bacterium]
MKRFHVHVAVHDLEKSVRFYSALFAAEPTVKKDDYAKWQLDDPRVNFAISAQVKKSGLDHLGIQAEDSAELEQLRVRLAQADVCTSEQKGALCCYARSDKYWTIDPQGIAWESFHTLDSVPVYGEDQRTQPCEHKSACCAPLPA